MHHSHRTPPSWIGSLILRGGNNFYSIGTITMGIKVVKGTTVPSGGTEVIQERCDCGNSFLLEYFSCRRAGCWAGRSLRRLKYADVRNDRRFLGDFFLPTTKSPRLKCETRGTRGFQCAGVSVSTDRPTGGTTTVDRLPSAVSF